MLKSIYAEREPGLPAAFQVCVVAPRQNLKSATLEIAALTDLFVLGVPLSVWTAHEFKTARKSFEDMRSRILQNPEFESRCRFRDSHGEEAIILHTGERLEFHARSGGSGRGFSCDRLTLDEALFLRPADMGALLPTLVTRRDAQVRLASSAGFSSSEVLRDLRDRGRAGGDLSLAYVEYGAEERACRIPTCSHAFGLDGCALDDRELWEQANCALWADPPRITEEGLLHNRRGLPPGEFMREFLSWWEDPDSAEQAAIDPAVWASLADPDAPRGVSPAFGVATAPDRSWCAVAVATRRSDGLRQVELADYRPGTAWVPQRVAELRRRWGGRVAVDTPSRGLLLDVLEPSHAAQASAHNALSDAVHAFTVRHGNEPALSTAVRAARWRPMGDTRVLDRKGSADISPLVAVALALHEHSTGTPTGGWMVGL